MFKKRNNNSKKVRIQSQLDEIEEQKVDNTATFDLNDNPNDNPKTHALGIEIFPNRNKTIGFMDIEQSEKPQRDRIMMQQQKEQEVNFKDGLSSYFDRIKNDYISRNQNEEDLIQNANTVKHEIIEVQEDSPKPTYGKMKMDDEIDFQIQNKPKKPTSKMGTIIIEDDDPNTYGYQQNFLEVKQDFGGLGTDSDDSNNELNFEDELIRKTLTRNNYQNLQAKQQQSTQPKKTSKASKLKRTMDNIDENQIKKALFRDFDRKKNEAMTLQKQIRYLESRIQEKSGGLAKKKELKQEISEKLKNVSRVLEYIYYFGDQIQKNENGKYDKNTFLQQADLRLKQVEENQQRLRNKQKKRKLQDEQCQIIEDQDDQNQDVYMF